MSANDDLRAMIGDAIHDEIERLRADLDEYKAAAEKHWRAADDLMFCRRDLDEALGALGALEQWFSGIGLDHIPNGVFHSQGGFDVAERARAVIQKHKGVRDDSE